MCWTMYSRNSLHRLLVRNAELSSRRLSSVRTARSRNSLGPLLSLSCILLLCANHITTVVTGVEGFLTPELTVSRAFYIAHNNKIPLALEAGHRTKPTVCQDLRASISQVRRWESVS